MRLNQNWSCNEFASDALEGLESVQDKQRIQGLVDAEQGPEKENERKTDAGSHETADQTWLIIAVIIVSCW